MSPRSDAPIHFEISGPGQIIATDNGDPTDFTPFPSHDRKAFSGLCLAIVRSLPGHPGRITLRATSPNLTTSSVTIKSTPSRP